METETYVGIFATILGSYFWLVFLRKRDKYEPEPLHALLYVLVIGGGASTFFAGVGNEILNQFSELKLSEVIANPYHRDFQELLVIFIPSAFIEEFCKYTAAFFLIRNNKHVNEPVDGIIYAIAIGLGFSLFENFLYAAQFGGYVVIPRLLFAVPLHMASAAIWGIYLSQTLVKQEKHIYLNAMPYFLGGVAFHGLWNSTATWLGGLFFILAPLVLYFSLKRADLLINNFHDHSPFQQRY